MGAIVGLFSMLLITYVTVSTYSSIFENVDQVPNKPVALLLGASVRSSGALSPVLKERADAAYELYSKKKVLKILVSGDNSSLAYDEVYPVGKYLMSIGVPQSDIFLDYAGFDTYSSVFRAKKIFGVTSMIIVSQAFHLPRALFIARHMGISALGVDASRPGDLYINNTLREILATVKAFFDLLTHRQSRYLGPSFNVLGSGIATWVGPRTEMIYFVHE